MIVKDEEPVLARCIQSVHGIFDEIIIVDTGSTDNTKQIARQFTKRIYNFEWVDDFAKARNFSFSKSTKDFIMWLDADDIITDENREKILQLKNTLDPNTDMVTMKYDLGGGVYSTRERIFNRARNFKWLDPIHEYIPISPTAIHFDACISHKPLSTKPRTARNLRIYEKNVENGLSPRGQFYFARELMTHNQITRAIDFYNLFLGGNRGWVEDNIIACRDLARCYQITNNRVDELKSLVKSFEYDAPRAETCCMLGYYYKSLGDFALARNWFETAINLPTRQSFGFVNHDFSNFIPAIELAVCFDRLGDFQTANHYNELAGKHKPQSREYLANKNYFVTKLLQTKDPY